MSSMSDTPADTTAISFSDWEKIDVRLGTILEASNPDWSNKLIELHVDFGAELGERTIFTGMRKWKTPEDFIGKQALFLCNLPPKQMGDKVSQGMILALDPLSDPTQEEPSNSGPVVLLFDNVAPAGSKVA